MIATEGRAGLGGANIDDYKNARYSLLFFFYGSPTLRNYFISSEQILWKTFRQLVRIKIFFDYFSIFYKLIKENSHDRDVAYTWQQTLLILYIFSRKNMLFFTFYSRHLCYYMRYSSVWLSMMYLWTADNLTWHTQCIYCLKYSCRKYSTDFLL